MKKTILSSKDNFQKRLKKFQKSVDKKENFRDNSIIKLRQEAKTRRKLVKKLPG